MDACGVPGAAGVLTVSDNIVCTNAGLRAREESLSQVRVGAAYTSVLVFVGDPGGAVEPSAAIFFLVFMGEIRFIFSSCFLDGFASTPSLRAAHTKGHHFQQATQPSLTPGRILS